MEYYDILKSLRYITYQDSLIFLLCNNAKAIANSVNEATLVTSIVFVNLIYESKILLQQSELFF